MIFVIGFLFPLLSLSQSSNLPKDRHCHQVGVFCMNIGMKGGKNGTMTILQETDLHLNSSVMFSLTISRVTDHDHDWFVWMSDDMIGLVASISFDREGSEKGTTLTPEGVQEITSFAISLTRTLDAPIHLMIYPRNSVAPVSKDQESQYIRSEEIRAVITSIRFRTMKAAASEFGFDRNERLKPVIVITNPHPKHPDDPMWITIDQSEAVYLFKETDTTGSPIAILADPMTIVWYVLAAVAAIAALLLIALLFWYVKYLHVSRTSSRGPGSFVSTTTK